MALLAEPVLNLVGNERDDWSPRVN